VTITDTAIKKLFPGNAAATTFDFDFDIWEEEDVTVVLVNSDATETTLTLNVDYSVAVYTAGGRVTYPLAGAPLAADESLLVYSDLDLEQPTPLPTGGAFLSEVLEEAIDKNVRMMQQIKEELDRSFKLPISSELSATLPTPVSGAAIGFDGDGNLTTLTSLGEGVATTAPGRAIIAAASYDAMLTLFTFSAYFKTLITAANAAAIRALLGSNTIGDTIFASTTAAEVLAALGLTDSALPPWWVNFTAALDADTDHDVNFTGSWKAYDQSCDIVISDMTKQIDAVWAAGDDAGGRAAGVALANTTWYHGVAVAEADGSNPDIVFDTDITASNHRAAHAEYTAYRYTGLSVLTDGSANITAFIQVQDTVLWSAAAYDVNVSDLGTSAVLYTLSVPPGVKVKAKIIPVILKSAADAYAYLSAPDQTDEAASGTLQSLRSNNTGAQPMPMDLWTNTSSQVRARGGQAATDFDVHTVGWALPQGCRVGI